MTVVPTMSVRIAAGYEATEYEIRKVAPFVKEYGLIEPLKLDRDGTIGRLDPWDAARLEYCRREGWSTVIVAEDCE